MLQTTPTLPARGGNPKALTGVINTVVGQIAVTTADQLPEQRPEPASSDGPHRLTKLQVAQLMKDRMDWQNAIDGFTADDADQWNAHKDRLKVIANMSRKEKIELFERFRKLASGFGIDYDEAARTFVLMPLPGDDQPL